MTTFYSIILICVANKNHFSSAKEGVEIHTWPISPPVSSGSRLQRAAFGFIASEPSWLPGLQEAADGLNRTQWLLPACWSALSEERGEEQSALGAQPHPQQKPGLIRPRSAWGSTRRSVLINLLPWRSKSGRASTHISWWLLWLALPV